MLNERLLCYLCLHLTFVEDDRKRVEVLLSPQNVYLACFQVIMCLVTIMLTLTPSWGFRSLIRYFPRSIRAEEGCEGQAQIRLS